MARNGSGVYSLPAAYLATTGDTILATQHNTPLEDLESDANTARPIVAGGTGATSAADARTNLGVPDIAGDTFTGAVTVEAALTVTDSTSTAIAAGPNGTTNPVFQVDASASSAATGLLVFGSSAGNGVSVKAISSGTNETLKIDSKGTGLLELQPAGTGNVTVGASKVTITPSTGNTNISGTLGVSGATTLTNGTSTALTVGPNGATNPVFQVDASAASSATGVLFYSAAAGSGAGFGAISSGANEVLKIDSKGTGKIKLQSVSGTGNVEIGASKVTFAPATGNTAIAGTLAVTAAATFSNTLTNDATVNAGNLASLKNEGTGSGTRTLTLFLPNIAAAGDTSTHFIIGQSGGQNNLFMFSNGNITNQNNSYGAISDVRRKKDIVDAPSMINDFLNIKFRQFRMVSDADDALLRFGAIAQEVQQVASFADLVEGSEEDFYSLNYAGLALRSARVLQEFITATNNRIAALEAALAAK